MRILELAPSDGQSLLSEDTRADYVYMYPPRQAYRPLDGDLAALAVDESLGRAGALNLYVHVPFCRQICAFCNLYALGGVRAHEHARYVAALRAELEYYSSRVRGRELATIYIGGGTPSLLDPLLIGRVLRDIRDLGFGDFACVQEVALEVAPDTAAPGRLEAFRAQGVNRINLGVQSWSDDELARIGRRHGADVAAVAIRDSLEAGFDNVCVDLIYGLEGQTNVSWRRSVSAVAELRPETICCYPLTLREWTGFAGRGYLSVRSRDLYARYDLAHEVLLDAGYVQETHVRWVIPGRGGYVQKENHWAGQDILGLGAGARSYLHEADVRNGYSVRHRNSALAAYYESVAERGHARTDGFQMDEDERRRKHVILGLGDLSRERFLERHGVEVAEVFEAELNALHALGAVEISDDRVALTELGHRHRDVIVQMFFSERVRGLISTHSYDE